MYLLGHCINKWQLKKRNYFCYYWIWMFMKNGNRDKTDSFVNFEYLSVWKHCQHCRCVCPEMGDSVASCVQMCQQRQKVESGHRKGFHSAKAATSMSKRILLLVFISDLEMNSSFLVIKVSEIDSIEENAEHHQWTTNCDASVISGRFCLCFCSLWSFRKSWKFVLS